MNAVLRTFAPSATTQLRADHAQVLSAFHQFDVHSDPETKHVLVNTVCRALDLHARLEEEFFYPAMYEIAPALIEKSMPEHREMQARISALTVLSAFDPEYDDTFFALMREVMRHVADEETVVLPQAERLLGEGLLRDLGAQMAQRRAELTVAASPDVAWDTLRAPVTGAMLMGAGAVIAASYLVANAFRR